MFHNKERRKDHPSFTPLFSPFAAQNHLPQAVLQGTLPDHYRNHFKHHWARLDTVVWFTPLSQLLSAKHLSTRNQHHTFSQHVRASPFQPNLVNFWRMKLNTRWFTVYRYMMCGRQTAHLVCDGRPATWGPLEDRVRCSAGVDGWNYLMKKRKDTIRRDTTRSEEGWGWGEDMLHRRYRCKKKRMTKNNAGE